MKQWRPASRRNNVLKPVVLPWLQMVALVFVAGCIASPAMAASLSGTYRTPLGKVKITERNGTIRATSMGKNKCGIRKRKVVFEGTRLDDSITGTIHACKVGPGCRGKASGMMMLLITRGGKTLSGAVHIDTGKCKTPLKGDGITISLLEPTGTTKRIKLKSKGRSATRRRRGKKAAATGKTVKAAAPSEKSALEKAEAIASEGAQLLGTGKIEEAREKFTEAVEVAPEYSNGYQGLGVTYYLRGRYSEALIEYKRAIEANPANGDTYYNMACVYALQEKTEQAFRYLSIAVVNGYVDSTFAEDEDLVSLKSDPRWEQIKMGLPVASNPFSDDKANAGEGEKSSDDVDEKNADAEEPSADAGADQAGKPDATGESLTDDSTTADDSTTDKK